MDSRARDVDSNMQADMPRRGTYWMLRPQLWLAVITVALAAPGLAVSLVDNQYRSTGGRLMPELMWMAGASGLAIAASLLAAIALLVWKGRARMTGRRPLFKVLYSAASIVSQAVVAAALFGALFAANFHLFEGNYQGQKGDSPDGKRTAYLYGEGLFCGYKIFVREAGETRLVEHDSFTAACDDLPAHPRLQWSPDSLSVSVTNPDGSPIPHKDINLFPIVH
jgi:hypothetical protein